MKTNFAEDIAQDGFALVQELLDTQTIDNVLEALANARIDGESRRAGKFCLVARGGAMLMRPLLLHSSSTALNPGHRRVLHFEYSSIDLPGGLKWFEEDQ